MKNLRGLKIALLASTIGFSSISVAMAQLPADLQDSSLGQAGAGRVEERFQTPEMPERVMPSIEVRDIVLQDIPEGAENLCFQLDNLNIEGANTYSAGELQSEYNQYLGQEICLNDLYTIAGTLTNKYRNDGYILTQVIVPPQTIENNQASLRVIEGYLDQVNVEGDLPESSMKLIREYGSMIRTGGALNARDLERYLLLINDLPGITARSVLSPSTSATGAADLNIVVTRKAYDAYLAADNFGSRYLGPLQLTGAVTFNSPFGYNEALTLQSVVVPNPGGAELGYAFIGYDKALNKYGTKVSLGASYTATDPGYTLKEFDVEGRSKFLQAKLVQSVVRSRAQNLQIHGGFDWRNVTSSNILEPTREDTIFAFRTGLRYEALDTFLRAGANSFNVEFSQGLKTFGANEKNDPFMTRTEGDPQFSKLNAEIQRIQNVYDSVNLLVRVKGQIANNALLSSEEFGIGGMDIGRAYDPSEIIGDEGVSGKLELQWNQPYQFQNISNYQLYSFYDIGKVWNIDATTSDGKDDSLASAGFGARIDFTPQTQGGIGVAFPLTRDVETQDDKGKRIYLNISHRF